MSEGIDNAHRRLSDPLLDEIQFHGVSVGEKWRVQTDIEEFLQKYARLVGLACRSLQTRMGEWERRFGPLERQKQYIEIRLRQNLTVTEDQPFQIVAICENWRKPHEYLGVWVFGDSDIDEVAISVPGEESICDGTRYAVSPTGKLLDSLESQDDGMHARESKNWVNQWLIPRHYQGQHLFAQRDSDGRQWTILFDKSSVRTNSELQRILLDLVHSEH